MYFKISLCFWELQAIRETSCCLQQKYRWKIFENIFTAAYLQVISFTEHEKDTATEVYLEPSEISMMELFAVNSFHPSMFALFHFYKSSIIVAWYGSNTPLNYCNKDGKP